MLVTRKRAYIFFDAHLVCGIIFFQLIPYVFGYYLLVPSHGIYIIASALEVSRVVFVFEIRVPVGYHQATLPLLLLVMRLLNLFQYIAIGCFSHAKAIFLPPVELGVYFHA